MARGSLLSNLNRKERHVGRGAGMKGADRRSEESAGPGTRGHSISGRNADLDIVLLLVSQEVRLTKLPRPEAPNSASSASDQL